MKFLCDKCKTRYTISDEKVRGKVLKIRCKNCAHIIVVREPGEDIPVTATIVSGCAPNQSAAV